MMTEAADCSSLMTALCIINFFRRFGACLGLIPSCLIAESTLLQGVLAETLPFVELTDAFVEIFLSR